MSDNILTPRKIGGKVVGLSQTEWKEIVLRNYRANSEIEVSHSLNRIPKGFLVENNEPLQNGEHTWTRYKVYFKYPYNVDYKKIRVLLY